MYEYIGSNLVENNSLIEQRSAVDADHNPDKTLNICLNSLHSAYFMFVRYKTGQYKQIHRSLIPPLDIPADGKMQVIKMGT